MKDNFEFYPGQKYKYQYTMTEKSWNYLYDKSVIYYRKGQLDQKEKLDVDVFIEKYNEIKKENKKFIVMVENTEAHWISIGTHIRLHKVIEKAKIPSQNILFITCDFHAQEQYDAWCEKMNIKQKINVMSYQAYLHRQSKILNENPNLIKDIDFVEKKPSKKFICLLGKKRPLRTNIWNFIENNNTIKEQGYVSYLGKDIVLPNSWQDVPNAEERIKNGESSVTLDDLTGYHQDSYFSVVAETESGVFLTEKIIKPLLSGHPFIVLSEVGIGWLKLLKKYGFETFPEWFDESYDEIEDPDVRFRFIQKEIRRLCNMSNEYLSELYESVKDKLIHNKNNFLNIDLVCEEQFINDLMEISK